ncbi:type IV pilus twitching motility protein PilT [Pseudolactococcus carnosus]|uniref:type IV pilus twitching motility protein PilT n=1 Tax=Pseudolactococcus carnosus TaxID=2749961 RepID=UPI001FBB3F91|nr:type IV pilus twitching motility protein PilT [Lactococcus carnosus]
MSELKHQTVDTRGVLPAVFRNYCVAQAVFDTLTMLRILREMPIGMPFEQYLIQKAYLTHQQVQVFYDELALGDTAPLAVIEAEQNASELVPTSQALSVLPSASQKPVARLAPDAICEEVGGPASARCQLDAILTEAVKIGGSDIHFSVGLKPTYRRHGDLVPSEISGVLTTTIISGYGQVMCDDRQWTHFLEVGEVDLAYEIKDISRFRVNIYQQKGNTSIAVRSIPTKIPKLDDLKMPELLKDMVQKKQGLFLVTGPTGSGKSTTLAAMIDYLNRFKKEHIITLEDPIEYVHNHNQSIIDQREIGADTNSFANGLRAALRQDPDVILVGEMRDHETISIALTAAETGHLVLGTLHTSSAAATIERIVDVFTPEQQPQIMTQLSGALVGILAQRLLPTPDFNGRVAVTELMVNTPSIANLVRSNKTHQITSMLQMGAEEGMYTMESSIKAVLSGHLVDVDAAESLLGE